MLKTPTTQTDDQDNAPVLDNEPLPPADDDGEPAAPAAEKPKARSDDGDEAPEAKPQLRGDPKRDEIARLYREKQREEAEGEGDPPPDEGDNDVPPEGRAEKSGLSDSDDPELELCVYGKRLKRKRSELVGAFDLGDLPDDRIISIAQREMAADQRLAEAKEVSDQRRPVADGPTGVAQGEDQPADQPGAIGSPDANGLQPDGSPRGQHQAMDAEKIAEIANRIQIGDAEEGQKAIAELVELVRGQSALNPEQLEGAVRNILSQRDHQTEVYEALTRFRDSNPDLVNQKHLFTVALDMTSEEMLDDMRNIGLTDAQLKPLQGDKRAIAMAHRNLATRGHQVRTIDQVLTDSAAKMRKEFNLPAPGVTPPKPQRQTAATPSAEQTRERVTRKELAQPQPRHGGARVPASSQNRPLTARDRIDGMRKERGFRA